MRLFTSVVVLLHMLVASLVVRVICAFIFAITRAAIRLQTALRHR